VAVAYGNVAHQKVEFQLYVVMVRWERPRRGCLVVRANLVCTADQYDAVVDACRTIFQSLEPDVPPSTLPVPIRFDLPDGWEPASGDMSDAAFTAMKRASHGRGVTPTIRLRGQFRDDGPVGMADEFLHDLLESERDQVVASRRCRGSAEPPALIQTVSDCHIVDGATRQLGGGGRPGHGAADRRPGIRSRPSARTMTRALQGIGRRARERDPTGGGLLARSHPGDRWAAERGGQRGLIGQSRGKISGW
jgi:hypothetical protein